MATRGETGNRGRARRRRWALAAGVCLFALGLAGCSGPQSQLAGDPLFGEFGLRQPGPSSPPPASGAPARTQTGVPPIPSAQLSPSPAALAAAPLPGARPLAIDGSRQQGGILPTSAGGATLTPVVQPVPRDNPAALPAKNTWTPPAPLPADTAILQQLKTRGVLYHKIDALPDGVRLSVIVPSRTQPDAARIYEATGRDLSAAADAIVQKLDSAR